MITPEPADRNTPASETLGVWLRAQRLARKWAIAEMGRRLCRAAKESGDNTIVSASIMASYVRRWEHGEIAPTERYQMHYCAALDLAPSQFGSAPPPHSATNGSTPSPMAALQAPDTSKIVVVIPDGCSQVIIYLPQQGAASIPAPSGDQSHNDDHSRCADLNLACTVAAPRRAMRA